MEVNNKLSDLIEEKRFSKIGNLQKERLIKYFLSSYDKFNYKIIIFDQDDIDNKKIEINKSFGNKETALDLIKFLCENSIPPEQSNEVVNDLLRSEEKQI